jgi:diaminohydroxyphosphoribosylaminopyrimidine deaminase/5-amino-6-(5-phosphoribosylamino)uracil reductase
MFTSFDQHMMTIALALARRGLGRVAPNPSVGAVVADEAGEIVIARGVTQPGGRPHAEAVALAAAGERARGQTIYVTLEPCSHQGRAAPCSEAIIAAGIKRVVYAVGDPDPRVSGDGAAKLKAAGIAVETGLMAAAARELTVGHITRVLHGRPHITLKIACDAQGQVPRGGAGRPTWVTSPLARELGQLLRAENDAILVGRQTVVDDDPLLTCRLPGMADRSPIRVVLAPSLMPPRDCRLLATAHEVPVWVMTSPAALAADYEGVRSAEAAGARLTEFESGESPPFLGQVLWQLGFDGMTRLLVEGGPRTWRNLASEGLADAVELFQARDPGGSVGKPPPAVLDALLGVHGLVEIARREHDGFIAARFGRTPVAAD